jgi:peptide/nickel transport system permease protein
VLRLLTRRLLALVPLMFVVSALVFALVLMVPGDPAVAIAGDNATAAQIRATRHALGLDRPVVVRYAEWIGRAVHGDLGTSLFSSYPVSDAIVSRLPVTASLLGVALVTALLFGIPLGVMAGYRPGTLVDRVTTVGASVGVAIPNFWLGLLLLLVFALSLGWLPAGGYVPLRQDPAGWLAHLVLPGVTLGAPGTAEIARQMRGSLADVMQQDYIRTVRGKGMRTGGVLRHAVKNALVPVVTVAGLMVSSLFGLSVLVEQVFGLPGLGQLAVESVFRRDVPMIQGIVLFVTAAVAVSNLLVDVSYGYLQPKVRQA